MVECFLKEDNTAKVLQSTGGTEEKLTKSTPVGLDILNIDAGKTLANCSGGLISSKDTLSRGANVLGIGSKLLCKITKKVSELTEITLRSPPTYSTTLEDQIKKIKHK